MSPANAAYALDALFALLGLRCSKAADVIDLPDWRKDDAA
jgi:hypothetical protein